MNDYYNKFKEMMFFIFQLNLMENFQVKFYEYKFIDIFNLIVIYK